MIHLTRYAGKLHQNMILCGKIFEHPEPNITYLDVGNFESNETRHPRQDLFCTACLSEYTAHATKAGRVSA